MFYLDTGEGRGLAEVDKVGHGEWMKKGQKFVDLFYGWPNISVGIIILTKRGITSTALTLLISSTLPQTVSGG